MISNTLRLFRSVSKDFQRCESGQIAVIFALALLPVSVGVGASIDYSRGSQARTRLQSAMDSAVLAAAIDNTSNWKTVAMNVFNGNSTSKGGVVGTPTLSLVDGVYSGTVSASIPTVFLGVISIQSMPVKATAAATTSKFPVCVLGLNAFDSGAFDMNGNAKFNAPDCAVQANTKNNKGMTQEGKPTAIAKQFGVSGGHTGEGYSTKPKNGTDQVIDPYASIPFPSYTSCDKNAKGLTINGITTTLSPGTYCGGITLKGQARVTLNPGIYVMVNGPFLASGGSSVSGREVMIAFTGSDATLRLWGNSTLDLTSPVSGTYANFQFFQDVNDANGRGAWVSIGGNGNSDDASKATWDGIAYFPTQNFWVYGNTEVNANSPNMGIVAGQVWIQGNATLNVTRNNPRALQVAQTVTSGGARLIH